MDLLPVDVNVGPRHSKKLAPPHAGQHGAEPKRPPWLRRRLDEAANLLRREDRRLPLFAMRPLHVLGLGKHAGGSGSEPGNQLRNPNDDVGKQRDDDGASAFAFRGPPEGGC
jgi:hypothetical protein